MRWTVRTRRLIKRLPHLRCNTRAIHSTLKAKLSHDLDQIKDTQRLLLEHQIRYDHELTPQQFDRFGRLAAQLIPPSQRSLYKWYSNLSKDDQEKTSEYIWQLLQWEKSHPSQSPTADISTELEEEARRRVNARHNTA